MERGRPPRWEGGGSGPRPRPRLSLPSSSLLPLDSVAGDDAVVLVMPLGAVPLTISVGLTHLDYVGEFLDALALEADLVEVEVARARVTRRRIEFVMPADGAEDVHTAIPPWRLNPAAMHLLANSLVATAWEAVGPHAGLPGTPIPHQGGLLAPRVRLVTLPDVEAACSAVGTQIIQGQGAARVGLHTASGPPDVQVAAAAEAARAKAARGIRKEGPTASSWESAASMVAVFEEEAKVGGKGAAGFSALFRQLSPANTVKATNQLLAEIGKSDEWKHRLQLAVAAGGGKEGDLAVTRSSLAVVLTSLVGELAGARAAAKAAALARAAEEREAATAAAELAARAARDRAALAKVEEAVRLMKAYADAA